MSGGPSRPGLVLFGEAPGDRAGESISSWPDRGIDGFDDLLISAPGATVLDEFGDPIPSAGVVYAIHGGPGKLDDSLTPGRIDLSRLANGGPDELAGVVFLLAGAWLVVR